MSSPQISQPTRPGTRLVLAVLILVPCASAFAFRVAGDRPLKPESVRVRSSLVFDQYAVNRGLVSPTRYVQARFSFRNVGPKPIKITKLEPSCGCMQPTLEKWEYAPGEARPILSASRCRSEKVRPAKNVGGRASYRLETPADEVTVRIHSARTPRHCDAAVVGILPAQQAANRSKCDG